METSGAVKELRRRLSMSQQAFATALGMSIRAIANYESTRTPEPLVLFDLASFASKHGHDDIAVELLGAGMQGDGGTPKFIFAFDPPPAGQTDAEYSRSVMNAARKTLSIYLRCLARSS